MASLSEGTILQGRYRIVASHETGGSAVIYSAERLGLEGGAELAIKEVDPKILDYNEFENEARLLYSLSHPSIPKVYDFFVEDEKYYLVMEFIEGTSLESLVIDRGQGINPRDALQYGLQICDVFSYLHGLPQKVIHRDLKPGNLLLTRSGAIKLIDFGIARTVKPDQRNDTLYAYSAYTASPEQKANLATDERSDIYSFGATLYCLIMGEAPPQSITESDDGRDPALRGLDQRSPGLGRVVWRCMRYEPTDRYQSFAEVKEEVAELLKGSRRRARIRGRVTIAAFVAVAALALGIGFWARSRGVINPPPFMQPTGTVAGPTSVEAGQSFALSLQKLSLPDSQVTWMVRDVLEPSSMAASGIGNAPNFVLAAPGVYEATPRDAVNGRQLADPYKVKIYPTISGPDLALIGHGYELASQAAFNAARTYQWQWKVTAPSGAKSEPKTTAPSLSFAFTEVGDYQVTATMTASVGQQSVSVDVPAITVKTTASFTPVMARVINVNGDFTNAFGGFPDAWTIDGPTSSVAYDTGVGHSRAGSLRLAPRGSQAGVVAKSFFLERTGTYRLTVWIKGDQASGQFTITVRYRSRQSESFTAPDTVERVTVSADGSWRQLLLDFPVNRTDSSGEVHLDYSGTGTIWIDDFYVERPN